MRKYALAMGGVPMEEAAARPVLASAPTFRESFAPTVAPQEFCADDFLRKR